MINLDRNEIEKFEYVACGGFGRLYRNGDVIYKFYKEKVHTTLYGMVPNPLLKYHAFRINKLMKLDKKLMYTDLIKDTIFVDGKFAGVVLPFYDGKTLDFSMDMPYSKKIALSYEFVRNARELTNNFIYPMDYKLDNMMMVNGHAKIIDLDDVFTKVSIIANSRHQKRCISVLDATIKAFLKEFGGYPSSNFGGQIGRTALPVNYTYEGINNYLCSKIKKYPYIILYDNSDVFSNIRLLKDSRVRVIYTYKKYPGFDAMNNKLSRLKELGISIYDLVFEYKLDEYLHNISYSKIIEVNEDKLLEKKIK